MKLTKRKLKRIIREEYRRVLNESTGLDSRMEEFIIQQFEHSTRTMGTGFEIEIPNEPHIIEATAELLLLRYGIAREDYLEEVDGEFMVFYSPEL